MGATEYVEEPYTEEFYRCTLCGGTARDHTLVNRHTPVRAPGLKCPKGGVTIGLMNFQMVRTPRVLRLPVCPSCHDPIRGRSRVVWALGLTDSESVHDTPKCIEASEQRLNAPTTGVRA